ncbi:hypothetical protein E2C01_079957 [Portunus trituberculatus]|uniref:Uncharacterized protein n=1 Tax=Portunus trituberculatus TaxID=210409 RepID=A0A5B7IY97_PORTR|nr:hypothetical protein [Portunus trituberculatus]
MPRYSTTHCSSLDVPGIVLGTGSHVLVPLSEGDRDALFSCKYRAHVRRLATCQRSSQSLVVSRVVHHSLPHDPDNPTRPLPNSSP